MCFLQALERSGGDISWVSTPVFYCQWNSVILFTSLFFSNTNWLLLPHTYCFLTSSVHLDLFATVPTTHTLSFFFFFFFKTMCLGSNFWESLSDWSSFFLWARPYRSLPGPWIGSPLHQLNENVKITRVTWKNMATCFSRGCGWESVP